MHTVPITLWAPWVDESDRATPKPAATAAVRGGSVRLLSRCPDGHEPWGPRSSGSRTVRSIRSRPATAVLLRDLRVGECGQDDVDPLRRARAKHDLQFHTCC
jgi:hypothetical protein